MNRRTKIVCTLGPATSTRERIEELVLAGMDVARLNLSHGTQDDHRAIYDHIRDVSNATGRAVGVLLDLQGPKIRLGEFAGGEAELTAGDTFTITTKESEAPHGSAALASTTYADLARDVKPGDQVLIDDGNIRLEVLETDGVRVKTRVIEGGPVKDHKGINLPGAIVSAPALSDKDRADLEFGLSLRVDLVALSFVRRPEDVLEAREFMAARGAELPIIVKLEKPEAVARLRDILEIADALMVARGDLGVEMPLERVPAIQKQSILLARRMGKPVIVATQMLESMIEHSRPTRAEASDVANAILDGADAIMLSGETSVGAHPIEAVRVMNRIVEATESGALESLRDRRHPSATTKQEAIAESAVRAAQELNAAAVAVFTQTGVAVRLVAKYRPSPPLLAFTTEPAVRSQLTLVWGAETFIVPAVGHTDEMVRQVERALLDLGRAKEGDMVVIVAGTPPGRRGTTNMLKIHRLGDPS
jgi:pyruvate kinase